MRTAVLAFACLLYAGAAPAAEDTAAPGATTADTMYVAPRIVVRARRVDRSRPDRSGFVASIDMRERGARVEDLSSVLAQMVGVRVNQYGGMGSFATASIRGSSSGQVRVFLDGVPLDDAYLGTTDLSQLPLDGVGRVDVYRGFSPPSLGGSAIGGAVNLVTWPGKAGPTRAVTRAQVNESYGSYDTSRHSASVWSRPPHMRLFAHAGYSRSLGNFQFRDDNGTPETASDDEVVSRANNDFESWNALLRAEADVPGVGTVSAGHDASWFARGVPGIGSYQSRSAHSDRRWQMTHMRVESSPLPRLSLHAMAFTSRAVDAFSDPDATVSLTATRSENTIRSIGGRAGMRWLVPALPVALEGAFEGRYDRFHPTDALPARASGPDRWRHSTSTSVGGDLYLLDQSLVVSTSQRFEWQSNEFYDDSPTPGVPPTPRGRFAESYRSPGVGVRWQVARHVTLKANAARSYRLPTFLELFGTTGAVTGNAALRPERGLNRDAGAVVSFDRLGPLRSALLEAVYLDNEVDDLILFFPNSQRTSRPVNIGSARIRGVELSVGAGAGALRVDLNYAWLDAIDTSDISYYQGNDLPSRPRHDLRADVSYTAGPLRATYELHAIGANYLDRANLDRAGGRRLHNVTINLNVPATGISFTFEGRNLSDDQVSDVGGFPLPGRSFYSTIGYHYAPSEG